MRVTFQSTLPTSYRVGASSRSQRLETESGFGQLVRGDHDGALVAAAHHQRLVIAAVLMREHGVSRICTRDTDFHRFPFLSVVDPLRIGVGRP